MCVLTLSFCLYLLYRYLKMYAPVLSQYHYNMCEMKGVLAQRIGGDNPQHLKQISQNQLIRKITLYKEILEVYQTIAPGALEWLWWWWWPLILLLLIYLNCSPSSLLFVWPGVQRRTGT